MDIFPDIYDLPKLIQTHTPGEVGTVTKTLLSKNNNKVQGQMDSWKNSSRSSKKNQRQYISNYLTR